MQNQSLFHVVTVPGLHYFRPFIMLRAPALRAVRNLRQTPTLARFYHEKVIDHYERPRNVGSLPKNDVDVGTGLYILLPPP